MSCDLTNVCGGVLPPKLGELQVCLYTMFDISRYKILITIAILEKWELVISNNILSQSVLHTFHNILVIFRNLKQKFLSIIC